MPTDNPRLRMNHVGLIVKEMAAMVEFYGLVLEVPPPAIIHLDAEHLTAKLGFPAVSLRVAEFELDGCSFELLEYVEPAGRGPALRRNDAGAMHICLEVADLDTKYGFWMSKGITAVSPPVRSVKAGHIGKYSVNLIDPEQNLVEFMEIPGRKQ